MKISQAPLSLAGIWKAVDDSVYAQANGGGFIAFYGIVGSRAAGGESVVTDGWFFANGFGTGSALARPAQVHAEYLAHTPDGTLSANSALLGSDITNGAGSVIVADFNGDGRSDIFLPAHNESRSQRSAVRLICPMPPAPSTASV